MNVEAAFLGLYCNALRVILPCLTGQETKVFLALALHSDAQGKGYPGVRLLSDLTAFPPDLVSELLGQLQARDLVLCLRKAERDPLTGRIIPDVWIVNPEIVVVSDPILWNEFRLRHSSIPESPFPVKSAQAESDSQKQKQRSISSEAKPQAFDGAATLQKTNANAVANRAVAQPQPLGDLMRQYGVTNSTTGSANAPNSDPQGRIPPGSGASPLRPLTFQESIQVNAIRQHIADMSAKTAMELVSTYGVELVNQAVLLCQQRDKKAPIAKKTGWIKSYLKSTRGAKA